jgi:hypothetical protein
VSDPKPVRDVPETLDDEADSRLVGVTERGEPMYYDSRGRRVFPAVDDGDGVVPDLDSSWDVSPGETVDDVVDEIEAAIGWDSLVDDEDDDEGEDEGEDEN